MLQRSQSENVCPCLCLIGRKCLEQNAGHRKFGVSTVGRLGRQTTVKSLSAGPLGVQQGVDAQPEPQDSQTEPPFEIEPDL